MADNCIICDVAIVGSGFAGSLIAKELSQRLKDIKVVIIEAGPGIQPNINDYLREFYKASVKVPESPYPPALTDSNNKLIDPANVAVGRPTSRTLSPSNWKDSHLPILIRRRK